jgi:hypothetical protein
MRPFSHCADLYASYLLATFLCLTRSGTRIHFVSKESFDYRYFYPNDEEFGNYTCGLARDAAALVLRQAKPSKFLDNQWLRSFSLFKGNPSVLRSMVEQSCLSAISSFGFNQGTVHWKPTPSTLFEGDLIHRLPPRGNDCSIFSFPMIRTTRISTLSISELNTSLRKRCSWYQYRSRLRRDTRTPRCCSI